MSDFCKMLTDIGNDRRINAVLLSADDVDRIYNISRATLYRRTAAGQLRAKKIGRRTFWVHDSIREYLDQQPAPVLRTSSESSRFSVNDNAVHAGQTA